MLSSLKGMLVTFRAFFKPVITAEYPKKHLPLAIRYMGFPVLTWDEKVGEPYCTGCMVCVRVCPTQCMSAQMMDNPLQAEGKRKRLKIIENFEINFGRCRLCGMCVDVCNFDAIEMSHQHELSVVIRNGNRTNLQKLLEMGSDYQQKTGWKPKNEEESAVKEEAST